MSPTSGGRPVLTAEIVFPLPLVRRFRYSVPEALRNEVRPGVRARAPLGRTTLPGFVVQVSERAEDDGLALKDIESILDADPVVTAADIALADALSRHFYSSAGAFLEAMLPPSLEVRSTSKARLTAAGALALRENRMSGEERKIGLVLGDNAYTVVHLKRRSGAKDVPGVVRRMERKGLVVFETGRTKRFRANPVPAQRMTGQLELDFSTDPALEAVLAPVLCAAERDAFSAFTVFGGRAHRWEAYASVIRRVIGRSKHVLVLVPELDLSSALKKVIEKRLGAETAYLHGQQSDRERESAWGRIRDGTVRIVIGPRSAVFSPLPSVGAVLVEEEHDEAYVQSESPAYDARTAARLLAVARKALLVSGSDAPSVEAFHRARTEGRLVSLPGSGERAAVTIVDDRREPGLLGRGLIDGLREALDGGRPALVFLNRRGFASFLFCPSCGTIPRCGRCRTPLTYHKKDARLVCRYGHEALPARMTCSSCGGRILEPRGAGIEALEEELKRLFPAARIAAFDADRAMTKSARDRLLRRFTAGHVDILAGTQLLAHRADLPPAGCVGILNPEALLAVADVRAGQRTLSILRRMLGFATPGGGTAYVQTAFPDHHAIRAAASGDYALFYEEEIKLRRAMDYPPFSAMAAVTLYGHEARSLGEKARAFVREVRSCGPAVDIFGPALAASSWPRGEKGVEVVLRAGRSEDLDACLAQGLDFVRARARLVRYD
jgi:primosomal protein N' (replication factor Y)